MNVPNAAAENTSWSQEEGAIWCQEGVLYNRAIGWHKYTSCSRERRRYMAPQRCHEEKDDEEVAVAEGGCAIVRGS